MVSKSITPFPAREPEKRAKNSPRQCLCNPAGPAGSTRRRRRHQACGGRNSRLPAEPVRRAEISMFSTERVAAHGAYHSFLSFRYFYYKPVRSRLQAKMQKRTGWMIFTPKTPPPTEKGAPGKRFPAVRPCLILHMIRSFRNNHALVTGHKPKRQRYPSSAVINRSGTGRPGSPGGRPPVAHSRPGASPPAGGAGGCSWKT